jgi:hypothetical protein
MAANSEQCEWKPGDKVSVKAGRGTFSGRIKKVDRKVGVALVKCEDGKERERKFAVLTRAA